MMWGAIQNESRPMIRCHWRSHRMPQPANKSAPNIAQNAARYSHARSAGALTRGARPRSWCRRAGSRIRMIASSVLPSLVSGIPIPADDVPPARIDPLADGRCQPVAARLMVVNLGHVPPEAGQDRIEVAQGEVV